MSMEFATHYDFVVLGEHPAGLWAAQQILKRGKKVLICPLGLDSGLNAIPRQIALDFAWSEKPWMRREENPIQILTPTRRFQVGATLETVESELAFQFGSIPQGNAEFSPELLRGLNYLFRGSETGAVVSEDWRVSAQRAIQTIYLEKEYGYFIRKMFRNLLEMGAAIAKPGQLKQIFIDRKNLVGVQVSESSKMISTKAGFLSAQVDSVRNLMNDSIPSVSDPLGWNYEIHFNVSPAVLPSGVTSRMLYVEPGAPILEITQDQPGSFHLRTALPLEENTMKRPFQRRLAERMLRVCERIIPDLEYNLKSMRPDLRDPEGAESMELPEMYPFDDLFQIPVARFFYGAGSSLGFQSPIANLFVANEESNPRYGLWGAYQAVSLALDAWSKRDPSFGSPVRFRINDFN